MSAKASDAAPTGMRGYSLIEVMTTLSIAAILTAIAVPMWNVNTVSIVTARRIVLANLRLARTNAITKSIHYQVSFPDVSHVRVSGMVQNPPGSATWVVDTTKVLTYAVPAGTQLSATALSVTVEFNTRGMVVNATTVTGISLTDSFGKTKSLQVWPSGQINEV